MLGDAGRELVGDPDRLVFFLILGSWLAYFNVRTRRFQNVVLGPAAVAAIALTASAHDELLVECLIAAGGTFVFLFPLADDAPPAVELRGDDPRLMVRR
jgi:hypothetical protein